MALSIHIPDNQATNSRTGVATNSLSLVWRHFVSKTGEVVSKATSSSVIAGVSYTQDTFASDNETVAKAKVEFEPSTTPNTYRVTITGGTITVADEEKFYNLSNSETVNGATESTTGVYVNTSDAGAATDPVVKMQVQLVKFISATEGIFRINI